MVIIEKVLMPIIEIVLTIFCVTMYCIIMLRRGKYFMIGRLSVDCISLSEAGEHPGDG